MRRIEIVYFVIFHFTLPEQVFISPDRHLTMWQNYEFPIRLCAFISLADWIYSWR